MRRQPLALGPAQISRLIYDAGQLPLTWYQSGQDPERLLPILSAYLGHVHIADTQWYLNASPELMGEAMRRMERRWGGQP